MPTGVYKHKPNQGFQKGHKFNIGNNWNKGKEHSAEHCLNIGLAMKGHTGFWKNKKNIKHPRWKGGFDRKRYKKEWVTKNYEQVLFVNRQRRLSKIGNGGLHTLEDWKNLKIKFEYQCLSCKKSEPEITLTEDHIIPLSKGGSDDISNIQPLCKNCNSKKYNKIIIYDGNKTNSV